MSLCVHTCTTIRCIKQGGCRLSLAFILTIHCATRYYYLCMHTRMYTCIYNLRMYRGVSEGERMHENCIRCHDCMHISAVTRSSSRLVASSKNIHVRATLTLLAIDGDSNRKCLLSESSNGQGEPCDAKSCAGFGLACPLSSNRFYLPLGTLR